MDAIAIIEQLHDLGITIESNGPKIRLEPGSKVPAVLLDEVRRNKASLMTLLSRSADPAPWPPPDSEELIARWKDLGCPRIPLAPGISVSDLHTWFYSESLGDRHVKHLAAIRGFLLEGLYPCEVPRADPLLEEWRRTSLPFWKRRLVEAQAACDARAIGRAKWMLEVLEDNENLAS